MAHSMPWSTTPLVVLASLVSAQTAIPSLKFVKTLTNETTGNLRDPSAMVRDPATGMWHFYTDYMPGDVMPGWDAYLHHYSAPDIMGPWTNHGIAPGLNHSDDPTDWDFKGTFSSSLIYSPNDEPEPWFIFYSASGANESALFTCAQMVARAPAPGGPWTKLGVVAKPTGSPEGNWTNAWNARRLDSGRALVIAGQLAYWTKGVMDYAKATEGVYFPANRSSFATPYVERPGNPVFPAPDSDPNGYENCEFFMGPEGEGGKRPDGRLMHVWCAWHGGDGPSGKSQGPIPHFVADPADGPDGQFTWRYVGSISRKAQDNAGEPTPVYEPTEEDVALHNGVSAPFPIGIPGDASRVRYFIARQSTKSKNAKKDRLVIGLYKLVWSSPSSG